MKPVNKVKHRGLRLKTVLILAAAAAVLTGTAGFFILRDLSRPEPVRVHTASEYVTELCRCAIGDVASVTITPPAGEPYTLLVAGDALVLEEDPSFPLRPSVTSLVKNNICLVRSENTVLDTADIRVDLKSFGLEPPVCACSFRMTDGTVNTLRIGSQISGGDIPYYYFMWNDDTRIFSGGTDMYSAFSYDRSLLHTVTQPSLKGDLLKAVTVFGENVLSLRYTEFGWDIDAPVAYPADPDKMEGYLKNISGILFSRYIAPSGECDLKALGLSDPCLTAVFTVAESILTVPDTSGAEHTYTIPEYEVSFTFGKAYDEYNRYVEYNGDVYTATYFLTDFLFGTGFSDLCLPSPFDLELYRLTAVEAARRGEKTRYDVIFTEQVAENGSLVTDENGNILYDCAVKKNGIPMDGDPFFAWYNGVLRGLVPYGVLPGASLPTGEPDAVFTLYGEKAERTVAFYPSGLQYMMAVNGTCVYYVSSQALSQLFPVP